MNRTIFVLALGAAYACAVPKAPPTNEKAQAPTPTGDRAVAGNEKSETSPNQIEGWFLTGTAPTNYRVERDAAVKHDGPSSARMSAVTDPGDKFGTLMQSVLAGDYAGKRVRLSACTRIRRISASTTD